MASITGNCSEQRKEKFKGNLSEDDWKHLWDINDLKFHQVKVYPDLIKYESILVPKSCRVFLPLCGKSIDLVYLADKGHEVFGCELVEKAVQDFFNEHNLTYSKNQISVSSNKKLTSYKAISKNITLIQGDFLLINSKYIGKFDAIWDRAAFVAINIEQRENYARVIHDIMSPSCKYLLNTFALTGKTYEGPPHNVSSEDLHKLFGDFCNITELNTESANPEDFHITAAETMIVTNSILTLK